jgi:hypothetical protein
MLPGLVGCMVWLMLFMILVKRRKARFCLKTNDFQGGEKKPLADSRPCTVLKNKRLING